ncbi:MAG: hypothetical protein FWG21_06910, partial [Oscillospiraceae bacterium]|nr:hypothetical protein [Oscillospiraceae bacterium]
RTKKRIVSLLLTVIMVMSMAIALPMTVMADVPTITVSVTASSITADSAYIWLTSDIQPVDMYVVVGLASNTVPTTAEAMMDANTGVYHRKYTMNSSTLGITADGLDSETTYKVYAYAVDGTDGSIIMSSAEFATLEAPPAAPVIAFGTTTNITTTNAIVNFTLSEAATVILRVYTGTHSEPTTKDAMEAPSTDDIGLVTISGPYYTDILDIGQTFSDTLQPNTTYKAYGIATNTYGTSAIVSTEFTTSPIPTYSVYVVTSTYNGGIGYANPNIAEEDEEVTLTTTVYPGSVFKQWIVDTDNVTIVNDKFIMPAETVSITAVFEKFDLKITAVANKSWKRILQRTLRLRVMVTLPYSMLSQWMVR